MIGKDDLKQEIIDRSVPVITAYGHEIHRLTHTTDIPAMVRYLDDNGKQAVAYLIGKFYGAASDKGNFVVATKRLSKPDTVIVWVSDF